MGRGPKNPSSGQMLRLDKALGEASSNIDIPHNFGHAESDSSSQSLVYVYVLYV